MKKRPAQSDAGLTLALNAAEGVLQMTFADANGKLVYGQWIEAVSKGAEMLAPSISHALSMLERQPEDIRNIAVVSGPGSFTGLRLTASTAAGLARSTGALQAGLNYMHLLARQCLPAAQPSEPAVLCCLMRARRDLVYAQCFMRDANCAPPFKAVTTLDVFTVSSGDAAEHILKTAAEHGVSRIFLAGTGVHENHHALVAQLSPHAPRTTLLDVTHPMPDKLMDAALEASYSKDDIEPLYVRASDAEENLPQIATRLGMDPEKAVEKLRALTHSGPEDTPENAEG
ncbi:MAG: hypothetical protein DELT_01134 [Desulfovibrio sp.]